MQQTVVYILGTSYSGSSLLNSLLDAQPSTRGLGEAVHFVNRPTDAWCSHCKSHVESCQLQQRICPDRIYESIFDAYPDAQILVNSSKNWQLCFEYMPIPAVQYRLCLVVLSKSLEEFANSYSAHEARSYEESFETWMRVYGRLFDNVDCVLNHSAQHETQQRLIGRIHEDNLALVSYREIALDTDATIQRICNQLDLPFNPLYREQLWRGDTCTIGGNNAIYAQQTKNEPFFQPQINYLDGKYAGRQGAIFYDRQWIENIELRRAADAWRAPRSDELEPMERRLRQQPVTDCTSTN